MTAPAIAPVTNDSTPSDAGDLNSLMSSITADVVKTAVAEPPVEQPRGPDGKFISTKAETPIIPTAQPTETPTQPTPADTPAQAPQAESTPEPEPVVLPEGIVAPPAITDRELATQFTLSDADGELEVPDVTITFVANGKQRTEPLDKVVKLAQFGVYNEERHQQNVAIRREAEITQATNQQLIGLVQQMQQDREQLLTNDQAYLTARARYEAENTPEAKVERANQQLQFTQAAIQGQQYFASQVAPAVSQIAKACPTVSEDEIGQRLLLLSDRFKVQTAFGSIINPAAFPQIEQMLLHDIVPWAAQLHTERDGQRSNGTGKQNGHVPPSKPSTPPAPAESAEVKRLQVEAQKARNLVGARNRPARTPGAPQTRETTTPKPITNLQDAEDAALDATFAAIGIQRHRGT